MKLAQIIAVEKSVKNQCNNEITTAYHEIQKTALFQGIARTYQPKDEEGQRFPDEQQKVQRRAEDLLGFTEDRMSKYWDMTLTKDAANQHARADVKVDGQLVIKGAPVTFLIFLEKQLTDLATMIKKLPVLDAGEEWKHEAAQDCYATEASHTLKTKKVPKAFVKSPATKEHPAQVETFTEDVIVGTWRTIKYSGAMSQSRIALLLERVTKLQAAVKYAREDANTIEAEHRTAGQSVFSFLLGRS